MMSLGSGLVCLSDYLLLGTVFVSCGLLSFFVFILLDLLEFGSQSPISTSCIVVL